MLLVKQRNKLAVIYCFSIQSMGKTLNDPKYGNSIGESALIISISSNQKDEMLVQINLNSFLNLVNDKMRITHNGKFGIKNALKKEFISRVQEIEPDLIDNGRVVLGFLPVDELLYMDNKYMTELLVNLIRYCNHRNQYKIYVINKII